jgi:hypothetical protein
LQQQFLNIRIGARSDIKCGIILSGKLGIRTANEKDYQEKGVESIHKRALANESTKITIGK